MYFLEPFAPFTSILTPQCQEHSTQLLRVACVGDSRAVLGRKGASGDWEAIALSLDQNGYNSDESSRLRLKHPNEPEMLKDGRLLGL